MGNSYTILDIYNKINWGVTMQSNYFSTKSQAINFIEYVFNREFKQELTYEVTGNSVVVIKNKEKHAELELN